MLEHVPPDPGPTVGERIRAQTPLEVAAARAERPLTEAERGALGLTDATGSYVSPDAHRGRCQICRRRPGNRVWCVYCQRGVGPGCCLLCEFPRTDRYRRGICVQCLPYRLPTGGVNARTPIQNVQPVYRDTSLAANVTGTRRLNSSSYSSMCRSSLSSVLRFLLLFLCCVASIAGNEESRTRPHRRGSAEDMRSFQNFSMSWDSEDSCRTSWNPLDFEDRVDTRV